MSVRVSAALLERCAQPEGGLSDQGALNVVRALGGLARWWLVPEVLTRAARRMPALEEWRARPALPPTPGGCWVVLVTKRSLPLLRPGLVLPLCWRQGAPHAPRLPAPLRALAEQVAGQFGAAGWGLDLNDEAGLAGVDLGGLGEDALGAASGWAAVAGGLVLARQDRVPRADVWATAAWHPEFGVGQVEGLDAKLAAAEEWGARAVFLPAGNQVQALEWLRARGKELRVEPLMPVARDPRPDRVLAGYLARAGAEPPSDAPFERRRNHYASIGFFEAQDYYWRCLLPDAVTRCAAGLRGDDPDWQPTHLVTVVGGTASVVVMGPLAAGVKQCLLLHEEGEHGEVPEAIAPTLEKVKTRLQEAGVACTVGPVRVGDRASELGRIGAHLRAFAAGVDPGKVVVDLTPGFKPLTLALGEVAPQGCWFIYCRHRQVVDTRVDPGTERHERWRCRAAGPG